MVGPVSHRQETYAEKKRVAISVFKRGSLLSTPQLVFNNSWIGVAASQVQAFSQEPLVRVPSSHSL
jgi:hypothetical protein